MNVVWACQKLKQCVHYQNCGVFLEDTRRVQLEISTVEQFGGYSGGYLTNVNWVVFFVAWLIYGSMIRIKHLGLLFPLEKLFITCSSI